MGADGLVEAIFEVEVAAKGAGNGPEAKQLSHQEFQHGYGSGGGLTERKQP